MRTTTSGLALVSSLFITLGPAQDGVTVPSEVLATAGASPVEFAMALAYASVPAGLEIRESDDVMPPTVDGKRPAWFNTDRTKRVSATEVVDAFNGSRRDYQAVLMGRVLVIRPVDGRLAFLDEPSSISGPTRVTGVMAAARLVFGLAGPVLNSLGHNLRRHGPETQAPALQASQGACQGKMYPWCSMAAHGG